ncbi:MAG: hypothetical protein AAF483_20415 [Planctomycetota bacterium]
MADQPNPFDPPVDSPAEVGDYAKHSSRGKALLIAVISLLASALVGFQLLVFFAFSTIVDPALPQAERRQLAAQQFLFGDGLFQIFVITSLAAITHVSFISFVAYLCHAACRRPSLHTARILALSVGLILTSAFIGSFLVRSL